MTQKNSANPREAGDEIDEELREDDVLDVIPVDGEAEEDFDDIELGKKA